MAKSKKSEENQSSAAAQPKSGAKSKPAKSGATTGVKKPALDRTAKSAPKPTFAIGTAMIDTNLAASAAAHMLRARSRGQDKIHDNVSVDHIKQGLNKSHRATALDILDKSSPNTQRPNLPMDTGRGGSFGGQKSGQTNTDASRVNVPRRNAG